MIFALTGVVLGLLFVVGTLLSLLLEARAAGRLKDARVDDLLNRLASRTYAEYAAFQVAPVDVPERNVIYDETGLIEVDLDG